MFTLYHLGHEVGSTDFCHAGPAPNQRLGAFLPTPYGVALMPRVAGFLEATLRLKQAMERMGIDPESDPGAVASALETLPEGRRVLDVGRATLELELRNEHGIAVPFSMLMISDVREMATLAQRGTGKVSLPDDLGDWSYIISATFTPARVPDAATAASWLRRPGSRN
jgi:hypothetical protein